MPRSAPGALLLLMLLTTPARADPLAPHPGTARVTELHGQAFRLLSAAQKQPMTRARQQAPGAPLSQRPLQAGERLGPGDEVLTGSAPDTLLELTLADNGIIRLLGRTAVRLGRKAHPDNREAHPDNREAHPDNREAHTDDHEASRGESTVELRCGKVLVQADRMLGRVTVLTPTVVLSPEGTTYLVEVRQDQSVRVEVMEGAVRVTRPAPLPARQAVVLPGEVLLIEAPAAHGLSAPLQRPAPEEMFTVLAQEPLLSAFSRQLPSLSRMRDLADQQRRNVLPARNERLRRELSWRRPPLRPLALPPLFQPGPGPP